MFICTVLCSCVWDWSENIPDYLPLDDSNYPYAHLPRLVIETENFQQVRDKETAIPAKLQIYGKGSPESGVLNMSIKGHGFSSFSGMPKPSYKIEFFSKQSLLGLHKDKDWVLISNSADKTLLRNHITYKLYKWLGADYSPQTRFVELFLNRQYQGVYLLTETIKVAKHRVNICESPSCFLFEKSKYVQPKDVYFTSNQGHLFLIKSSNKKDLKSVEALKNHIDSIEVFFAKGKKENINQWFDIDSFIRFYWVQEFSKNLDGNFYKSIFMTWEQGGLVQFGPVWDFDLGYGNSSNERIHPPQDWYIRQSPWNREILSDPVVREKAVSFWQENRHLFERVPDSLLFFSKSLTDAAKNEFNRWPILDKDVTWAYNEKNESYEESVKKLGDWIKQRISWIDANLKVP